MIVHISLFYLKNKADTDQMIKALNQVPAQNAAIVSSQVGQNLFSPPPVPGLPDFADVAQIIVFDNPKDAAAYADSPAHIALRTATDHLIDHVCAAEFAQ